MLTDLPRWGAVYLAGRGELTTWGRWLLQAMAATITTPPAGVETTNFVLDGEGCHVLVTGERLVARDGLREDASITVRGTVRDLHILATLPRKVAGPSQRFAVEGDRRSADRLLEHLVLALQRAAAIETPTT